MFKRVVLVIDDSNIIAYDIENGQIVFGNPLETDWNHIKSVNVEDGYIHFLTANKYLKYDLEGNLVKNLNVEKGLAIAVNPETGKTFVICEA
jgi:urease beta subunit